MSPVEINVFAVLVCAAFAFASAALWYSPVLFGKRWVQAHGFSEAQQQAMQQSGPTPYITAALAYLVTAVVVSALVDYAGATGWTQGLWIGFLCWLGLAATVALVGNAFSDKPRTVFFIDTAHHLLYLLVMGAVLAAWR